MVVHPRRMRIRIMIRMYTDLEHDPRSRVGRRVQAAAVHVCMSRGVRSPGARCRCRCRTVIKKRPMIMSQLTRD